jgi:hypothetical protein
MTTYEIARKSLLCNLSNSGKVNWLPYPHHVPLLTELECSLRLAAKYGHNHFEGTHIWKTMFAL